MELVPTASTSDPAMGRAPVHGGARFGRLLAGFGRGEGPSVKESVGSATTSSDLSRADRGRAESMEERRVGSSRRKRKSGKSVVPLSRRSIALPLRREPRPGR